MLGGINNNMTFITLVRRRSTFKPSAKRLCMLTVNISEKTGSTNIQILATGCPYTLCKTTAAF